MSRARACLFLKVDEGKSRTCQVDQVEARAQNLGDPVRVRGAALQGARKHAVRAAGLPVHCCLPHAPGRLAPRQQGRHVIHCTEQELFSFCNCKGTCTRCASGWTLCSWQSHPHAWPSGPAPAGPPHRPLRVEASRKSIAPCKPQSCMIRRLKTPDSSLGTRHSSSRIDGQNRWLQGGSLTAGYGLLAEVLHVYEMACVLPDLQRRAAPRTQQVCECLIVYLQEAAPAGHGPPPSALHTLKTPRDNF